MTSIYMNVFSIKNDEVYFDDFISIRNNLA